MDRPSLMKQLLLIDTYHIEKGFEQLINETLTRGKKREEVLICDERRERNLTCKSWIRAMRGLIPGIGRGIIGAIR